jgi:hypothetical protein
MAIGAGDVYGHIRGYNKNGDPVGLESAIFLNRLLEGVFPVMINLTRDKKRVKVWLNWQNGVYSDEAIWNGKGIIDYIESHVSGVLNFMGWIAQSVDYAHPIRNRWLYVSTATGKPSFTSATEMTAPSGYWDGSEWSDGTYTPEDWDVWCNENDGTNWYWLAGEWHQLNFILARNVSIDPTQTGQIYDVGKDIVIPLGVSVAGGGSSNALPASGVLMSLTSWLAIARNNLQWLMEQVSSLWSSVNSLSNSLSSLSSSVNGLAGQISSINNQITALWSAIAELDGEGGGGGITIPPGWSPSGTNNQVILGDGTYANFYTAKSAILSAWTGYSTQIRLTFDNLLTGFFSGTTSTNRSAGNPMLFIANTLLASGRALLPAVVNGNNTVWVLLENGGSSNNLIAVTPLTDIASGSAIVINFPALSAFTAS